MPKAGHIAVFDRTWYGRVMVERIEGFCTETEWKRAYQEINEMESHLANDGAVVLSSGFTLIRMSRSADSGSGKITLPSAGRLQMRTGATGPNGISMRKR